MERMGIAIRTVLLRTYMHCDGFSALLFTRAIITSAICTYWNAAFLFFSTDGIPFQYRALLSAVLCNAEEIAVVTL